jgi:hypothetical protein
MRCVRWIASAVSSPSRVAVLLVFVMACRALSPVSDPKLGPGIREALARSGAANVMVALVSDTSAHDAATARAAVASAQDAVLATLDSTDFRLRQRYEAVPAFAGTVRSPRALDRLLAHPLVRRVDLDPGGGGSAVP